jgi:hypothetical protein
MLYDDSESKDRAKKIYKAAIKVYIEYSFEDSDRHAVISEEARERSRIYQARDQVNLFFGHNRGTNQSFSHPRSSHDGSVFSVAPATGFLSDLAGPPLRCIVM